MSQYCPEKAAKTRFNEFVGQKGREINFVTKVRPRPIKHECLIVVGERWNFVSNAIRGSKFLSGSNNYMWLFFEILFKCWQVVLWSSAIWPWNSESTAKKVIYFWMVFLFLHVKPNLGIRNFSLAYCVTLSKKNVAVPFAFSIRDFQYFRPQPLVVHNILAMMGK